MAMVLVTACAGKPPVAPAAGEFDVSVEPTDPLEGSIFDAVGSDQQDEWGTSGARLGQLVPPPSAFGGYRLASMQVDDQSGDLSVVGPWYPPTVRREDCAATIDASPMPLLTAILVPGRSSEVWPGPSLGESMPSGDADRTIGIGVYVFDDVEQRDAYAVVMQEFVSTAISADCGDSEPVDRAEIEPLDPFDTGFSNSVYRLTSMAGDFVVSVHSIGERIVFTMTAGKGLSSKAEMMSRDEIAAAVEVMVARLEAADLP